MSTDLVPVDTLQLAGSILATARALVIESEDAKGEATSLLGQIATAQKRADAIRTAKVKPLNDDVKRINEAFKAALAPLGQADALLRTNILAYNRQQQLKAAEAAAAAERQRLEAEALLRQAEEAERAKQAPIAEQLLEKAVEKEEAAAVAQTQAVLPQRTVRTYEGTSSVRKVWAFKLFDLFQVPIEYHALNETAVREAVRKGVRDIPGIDIYQDEQLAVLP